QMAPSDWPCAISSTRVLWSQVGSSLLTFLAIALPGAILAASGRRFTWAIPVGLAAVATGLVLELAPGSPSGEQRFGVASMPMAFGGASGSFLVTHPSVAIAMDLVLVSVPALAIAFVVRPTRRPRATTPKRHASWVATFVVAGALAAMWML